MSKKTEAGRQINNSGFTLIELSVVILVLGTIIALVATGYQSYQVKHLQEQSQSRVDEAAAKLYEYRKIHGFYPCPASLTAARNTADYGAPVANCTGGAPGTCGADGICTQVSTRADMAAGNVEIGALPFRELNMPESDAYDAYGSKLTYAITRSMTNAATIKENAGGISVVAKNPAGNDVDVFTPPGSGAFLILSAGKNKLGAYGIGGAVGSPCVGGQGDMDNCDYIAGVAPAVFRANNFSESSIAADHFDDLAAFNVPEERAMWRKGLVENAPEKNDDIIDMAENMVVMGAQVDVANAAAKLSVLYNGAQNNFDGSMYVRPDPSNPANTGKLITKQVCDAGNSNCFSIDNLATACPPGKFVTGIYNGAIQCGVLFYGCVDGTGAPDTSHYIRSIDASGVPHCDPVPPGPIPGQCGYAAGKEVASGPPSGLDLCNPGDASAVSGSGTSADPWTWTCAGRNGGATSPTCTANLLPPPYNGKCGGDNGATFTPPAGPSSFCSTGALDSLTGSINTGFNWYCRGAGPSHTDEHCASTVQVPPVCTVTPVDGVCDNSILSGCAAGTGTAINFHMAGPVALWECSGMNGGAVSAQCAKAGATTWHSFGSVPASSCPGAIQGVTDCDGLLGYTPSDGSPCPASGYGCARVMGGLCAPMICY